MHLRNDARNGDFVRSWNWAVDCGLEKMLYLIRTGKKVNSGLLLHCASKAS